MKEKLWQVFINVIDVHSTVDEMMIVFPARVNFINTLREAFSYKSVLSSFSLFGFVFFWQKNIGVKAAHKILLKLTPISPNLSTQPKAQICWSTIAQQVGHLFFYWWLDCLFAPLGSLSVKAARKHVDYIDPWSRFYRIENKMFRHFLF